MELDSSDAIFFLVELLLEASECTTVAGIFVKKLKKNDNYQNQN